MKYLGRDAGHHGTWKLGQMYCTVQLAASHVSTVPLVLHVSC